MEFKMQYHFRVIKNDMYQLTNHNIGINEMNGQHIVRQTYGPNAETIRKNPNYSGLRERNQEFGNVSKAGKLLRSGFTSLLQELGDKNVNHRLTQTLLLVKNLDTESAKGAVTELNRPPVKSPF